MIIVKYYEIVWLVLNPFNTLAQFIVYYLSLNLLFKKIENTRQTL